MATMSRFTPDSLQQALLRVFDMAAPDANVYMEIPAPDVRFAAIALLAIVALVLWRRLGPGRSATFALSAILLASLAAWLATTGNGRYFMALLVLAGPLAIALICLLPVTRMLKGSLALMLIALQVFVFTQQTPWRAWTMLRWTDAPYFDVRLGPQERSGPPTTYASLSLLSYGIIAPQFPASSRWINLYASSGTPRDQDFTNEFLRKAAAAGPIEILAPSLPGGTLPDGSPNADVLKVFNQLIAPRNLRLRGSCKYIASPGLVRMAEESRRSDTDAAKDPGFWLCPAVYEPGLASGAPTRNAPAEVAATYAELARQCPAIFPGGEGSLLRLPDGWRRAYASETRVYVLDNGQVWYQYWRSMNPVLVGTVRDVLAGKARVDCAAVRSDGGWKTGAQ
jgi:hypothetical protein